MSVSAKYRADTEERLGAVLPIRTKSMFGGVGVYAGAYFFALIDDDTLYFKVDDDSRPEFESRGMGPFRPFPDKDYVMAGYYRVPAEVLSDLPLLTEWMERAVAVAKRKMKVRKPRGQKKK